MFAAVCTVTALASLTACSVPRYAGRAESEQRFSDCEAAYYGAADTRDALAGQPDVARYLTAVSARSRWIEVAAQCADRFAEGVIRAAQSRHMAAALAGKYGIGDIADMSDDDASDDGTDYGTVDPAGLALDDLASASIAASALRTMASAEDRAGFAVEILTARSTTDDATLPIADAHKAAGERLIALANDADGASDTATDSTDDTTSRQTDGDSDGTADSSSTHDGAAAASNDPRRKVYNADTLLAHPDDIVDPATGLLASTYAVVEVTCAREELAAMAAETGATNAGSAGTAASSASTDASDATHDDATAADADDAADTHAASLRAVARLVEFRLVRAFAAGYPATDHALFD